MENIWEKEFSHLYWIFLPFWCWVCSWIWLLLDKENSGRGISRGACISAPWKKRACRRRESERSQSERAWLQWRTHSFGQLWSPMSDLSNTAAQSCLFDMFQYSFKFFRHPILQTLRFFLQFSYCLITASNEQMPSKTLHRTARLLKWCLWQSQIFLIRLALQPIRALIKSGSFFCDISKNDWNFLFHSNSLA